MTDRVLVLTAGAVEVGDGAHWWQKDIVGVTWPSSLRRIGYMAFSMCSGIGGKLELPAHLEVVGPRAFIGCSGIFELRIKGSRTSVDWQAFCDCTSLARVVAPDHLVDAWLRDIDTVLGNDGIFGNCPNLRGTGWLVRLHADQKPLRRAYWHTTMHQEWCTAAAKECVLAVLLAEVRIDQLPVDEGLPSLDHNLWLYILEFIPRDALGRAYDTPCHIRGAYFHHGNLKKAALDPLR